MSNSGPHLPVPVPFLTSATDRLDAVAAVVRNASDTTLAVRRTPQAVNAGETRSTDHSVLLGPCKC